MSKQVKFLVFIALISLTKLVFAETVYVSDTLRVGVRPEPGNNYNPVDVVVTGMKLNVLDRQKGFLKVETDKGVAGWIKDIYVTKEPPAIIRLEKMENKYQQQSQELKEAQSSLASIEDTRKALEQEQERLEQEREQLHKQQAEVLSRNQQNKATWYWWLLALLVLVPGTFFVGVQWSRQQSMKRLGGIRV